MAGAELQALVERKRAQLANGKPAPIADVLRRAAAPEPSPAESPIELLFLEAARLRVADLRPQFLVGAYRVDFAIPPRRLVVEIDGHEWHSTVEQRTRDAKRGRKLLMDGWQVVRFTGTEVKRGVHRCVDELLEIMEALK